MTYSTICYLVCGRTTIGHLDGCFYFEPWRRYLGIDERSCFAALQYSARLRKYVLQERYLDGDFDGTRPINSLPSVSTPHLIASFAEPWRPQLSWGTASGHVSGQRFVRQRGVRTVARLVELCGVCFIVVCETARRINEFVKP
jgi:hypothetical protein